MIRRSLVLSFVAVLLVACGDDEPQKRPTTITCDEGQLYDPATEECVDGNANATNNVNSANAANSTNNTAPNSVNSNNGNAANNVNTANNTNSTNNTNPNNTNPTNNANSGGVTECVTDPNFWGQIGGTGPHDGGNPVLDQAYPYYGGISIVKSRVSTTTVDDPNTPGVDEGEIALDEPVLVSAVLVIATDYGANPNRNFWIMDSRDAIQVRLDADVPVDIKVGDEIQFDVTHVSNYEGHPRITNIAEFRVTGISEPGGNVPVREVSERGTLNTDYGFLVKFGGEIYSEGTPCGGSKLCYEVVSEFGVNETLRTDAQNINLGDCVTYVGPLGVFPGPLEDPQGMRQLDVLSYDWLSVSN